MQKAKKQSFGGLMEPMQAQRAQKQTYFDYFENCTMSTIDIGIAELPAIPPIRVAAVKTASARPAPVLASSDGDFYVGSTKMDALPVQALQGAQPLAGQTEGHGV